MKSLYVDANSRTVQCARLSIGLDVDAAGVVAQIEPNQFIRVKAVGGDAVIRQENQAGDGVLLSEGETGTDHYHGGGCSFHSALF